MNVGFIGLGRMGRGIAGSILRGGNDLIVYNRTIEKTKELADAGAAVASSIAEVCAGRDVVASMLADDAALTEVVLSEGGVRESLPAGAIHMVMGTHGVDAIRTLAAAHAESEQILVAAPVLGRPDIAAAGELGIVAAGPKEAVRRCEPLLQAIGRRTFDAGEQPEFATTIKLANNFALGAAIETMGEAFSLLRKYGVSPAVFYDVLVEGLFAAPAYAVYGKIILEEDYDRVGFTTELALKDVNLVLAAADLARVPLPSANTYRDHLLSASAHGDGEKDWAVMAREQAHASGLD